MLVCRLVFIERFVAGATRLNCRLISVSVQSSCFIVFFLSSFPFFLSFIFGLDIFRLFKRVHMLNVNVTVVEKYYFYN